MASDVKKADTADVGGENLTKNETQARYGKRVDAKIKDHRAQKGREGPPREKKFSFDVLVLREAKGGKRNERGRARRRGYTSCLTRGGAGCQGREPSGVPLLSVSSYSPPSKGLAGGRSGRQTREGCKSRVGQLLGPPTRHKKVFSR